jgi:hypothetical protein
MKTYKSRAACGTMMVACFLAAFSGLATDYRNPAEVKQMIEEIMRQPQPQPVSVASYYGCCISHFDGIIPYYPSMTEKYDQNKPHYKYTYHDGRIAKCEFFEVPGKVANSFPVWNNSAGAPVLSGYFREDGSCDWYVYAEYDSSGKIRVYYRFNASFELQYYEEFSYEGEATRMRRFSRESRPAGETLYENGEVFLIENGVKRKVNNANREQDIRSLVRFGLKPLYPGY